MSDLEIREIERDDYHRMIRLLANAYPGFGMATSDTINKRVDMFRTSLRDKRKHALGAFRDDELIGSMFLWDYHINLHGPMVLSGGLGGVAVDLTHKKERVALDLVKYYLQNYLEQGAALAVLWPFRTDFYKNMGFGYGARSFQYRLDPKALPRGNKKNVRHLTADDIPAINDCYNKFTAGRTGMIEETEAGWQNRFELREAEQYIGCELGGELKAFMVFEFRRGNPGNMLDNHMMVHQIIYDDHDALLRMLAFLRAQADQISRVLIHTDEDEFYFLLSDVLTDSARTFHPIYQDSHMAGVGIMYRVLDVKAVFASLQNYSFGRYTGAITFDLKDNLIAANDGRLVVQFSDGRPEISVAASGEITLTMDIAEFSSLMMGSVRLRTLLDYRLAEISDPERLPALDRAFSFPHKPLTVTSF